MNELLLNNQQNESDHCHTHPLRPQLQQLQGQCRIKQIVSLKINYLKGGLFTLLLIISVVGMFLLKHFRKIRASIFYDKQSSENVEKITHVYIESEQSEAQISKIETIYYNEEKHFIFQFKKLRYQLYNKNNWAPLRSNDSKMFETSKFSNFIAQGLTFNDVADRVSLYGRNQHKVQVPSYPKFIFDTMTQPLFLFQYFVSLVYLLENYALFAVIMIAFAFITTTINYFLLRHSYNKVKQTAEKHFKVTVLREGQYIQIDNVDLVPGDLYIPSVQIPCDSIVVRGNLFVDQVSLTGQNVPIAKFAVSKYQIVYDKSHWLYQGSVLQTMESNTLALAVNVGYGSCRGKIIRKILNKIPKQPQFFNKIIYFQMEVFIVSIIIFLSTLPHLLSMDIEGIIIFFRFCEFITYSFPAPFPIFFNLAYSFCLLRLNRQNIIGTQAEKTVEGSRLRTICFDKTGTLTRNSMEVAKVYHFESQTNVVPVTNQISQYKDISDCFGCCNSVESINDQIKGDEIDLRLFQFVNSTLKKSNNNVLREIQINGRTIQVLKINQYESQFQSMSVLIKDTQNGIYRIYVKGNPQMIHSYSKMKFKGFDDLIKKLSFSGFRSIGFGFKEIEPNELQYFLNTNRQEFLKNICITGIVTFTNKIKQDAKCVLKQLSEANINTKIITGDNIYLGIQTAYATGIIDSDKKVIVIEGTKYNEINNSIEVIELSRTEKGEMTEQKIKINDFQYSQSSDSVYAIDNDFIVKRPQNFLSERIKVFARISPQNKALIVRKHKERELELVNGRKGWNKILGDCSFKVGMVGDGANDLIALKEADLGIAISSSDAIYSASFAVKELSQIINILSQSKNVERQIYEMAKYYGITQFISIIASVIISFDCSYFTSVELMYKNFVNTLLITFLFVMSKPTNKLTPSIPNSNFVDLQNHLVYWGNILICASGFIISYVYYSNSDDFIPNTHKHVHFPQSWYGLTKSSTINFITNNIAYISLPIVIFQSAPWKLPIWKNKPLFIVILINIILIVIISFSTQHLSSLTIQPIGIKEVTIVIIIMAITVGILAVYNILLQKLFVKRRQMPKQLLISKEQLHFQV